MTPLSNKVFTGSDEIPESVRHLLFHCGSLKKNEKLVILSDPATKHLAEKFQAEAGQASVHVRHFCIDTLTRHGQDPPSDAAAAMADSDLIVSICTWSLAHSEARIVAAKAGARFLSLPYYSEELLLDPSVMIDYRERRPVVEAVTRKLTNGSRITIRSEAGTDIELAIAGRTANCCPGIVESPGELGSPPDVEANIAPLETETNGVVVIDGSITTEEIGLLDRPVKMWVENGKVVKVDCENRELLETVESLLGEPGSPRRVIAECGIGLNPKARLTGIMLTDEGSMGSVHFGLGSNSTIGGLNRTDFHLDFVFKKPILTVDSTVILEYGELKI